MTLRWSEVVEEFLLDRATLTKRGLSEASRQAYRADLLAWATNVCASSRRLPDDAADALDFVTIDDLTADTLKAAYRIIRTVEAPATAQRRIGTLRLFTRWLQLEGHLPADPTLRLEAPQRPERLPAGWNDDELRRLAEAVWEHRPGDTRRWPARDHALFAMLATTGLRASELCQLGGRSMRAEPGGETVLEVIGKGNKQRNVPVPPETVDLVVTYIAERDARFGTQDARNPLLRMSTGSPMTRSALNHLVQGWIRRAGVPKQDGEAAHGFRHSFAKGLIRAGVPVPTVQALLGHADLKTTGIYVKATANDLRDAALASPIRDLLRTMRSTPQQAPAAGTSLRLVEISPKMEPV